MSKTILSQIATFVIFGLIIGIMATSLLPLMLGLITDGQWLAINAGCIAVALLTEVLK